jgi:hypothetical protein
MDCDQQVTRPTHWVSGRCTRPAFEPRMNRSTPESEIRETHMKIALLLLLLLLMMMIMKMMMKKMTHVFHLHLLHLHLKLPDHVHM